MCDKAVNIHPFPMENIPKGYKSQKYVINLLINVFVVFISVTN